MSLYEIGESYYIKEKYEEALNYFEDAYDKEENKIDTLNYIGCCYMNLGYLELALDIFDEIFHATLWEVALCNKGRVYLKLENYSEALAHFSRARMVNPENEDVYYYLGIYYDKVKDYNTAKEYYETAIEINDQVSEYHLNLGLACFRVGESQRAAQEFDICISMNEDYTKVNAIFNKGMILYYDHKNYEGALQLFLKAVELSPNDLEFMNMAASAFFRLKEYEKSLLWTEKVLQIDCNNKKASGQKALLLKALQMGIILD